MMLTGGPKFSAFMESICKDFRSFSEDFDLWSKIQLRHFLLEMPRNMKLDKHGDILLDPMTPEDYKSAIDKGENPYKQVCEFLVCSKSCFYLLKMYLL